MHLYVHVDDTVHDNLTPSIKMLPIAPCVVYRCFWQCNTLPSCQNYMLKIKLALHANMLAHVNMLTLHALAHNIQPMYHDAFTVASVLFSAC